jgi:hypothetical protein
MAPVSSLWGRPWFKPCSPHEKLTYLYCLTRPGINKLGLFFDDPEHMAKEIGLSMEQFNTAMYSLLNSGEIDITIHKKLVWFWVKDLTHSYPKSGPGYNKAVREFEEMPQEIRDWIKPELPFPLQSDREFVPPTAEQATAFAVSMGYMVDGQEFVDYYANNNWKNSRGKPVKDWKSTLRNVWCRPERKIPPNPGAPKGSEFFHVMVDGSPLFPKKWRNGLPFGDSIVEDKLLQKGYEQG